VINVDRTNGVRLVTDPIANISRKVVDLKPRDTLLDGRVVDHIQLVTPAVVRVIFRPSLITNERLSALFTIGERVVLQHP
jgi:hypothetical protein